MRKAVLTLLFTSASAFAAFDFDREIRPILSDKCFSCHGPDAAKRMANLRFDTADGGAFSNSVIVPGKAADSHLFARISATGPNRMPPVSSGRTLTPQQIAALKQWIDEGREFTLLDTRNTYEVKLGTFAGAVTLPLRHFRKFPEAVDALPTEMKQTPLVSFCTGGIRCEKAAPYLERAGFREVFLANC